MSRHEISPSHEVKLQTDFGLETVVNPGGAFVESLRAGSRDLILPRQEIDGKDRGGIPICAPVFGPAERLGLEQHGFARKLPWQIFQQESSSIGLSLEVDEGLCDEFGIPAEYLGCSLQTFIVTGSSSTNNHWLNMILKIKNGGQAGPQVVAPGFHPYFPTASEHPADAIMIGSPNSKKTFNDISLKNAETLGAPRTSVEFELVDENEIKTNVQIRSTDLTNFVAWSASPEKYICVEPTMDGPVGLGNTLDDLHFKYGLLPGQSKQFTTRISWFTDTPK